MEDRNEHDSKQVTNEKPSPSTPTEHVNNQSPSIIKLVQLIQLKSIQLIQLKPIYITIRNLVICNQSLCNWHATNCRLQLSWSYLQLQI